MNLIDKMKVYFIIVLVEWIIPISSSLYGGSVEEIEPTHLRRQRELQYGSCLPAIRGFTLINADTDTYIGPLQSDFNVMSNINLNIQAEIRPCDPNFVDSVRIQFDNVTNRCEKFVPFVSFGDFAKQDTSNDKANYRGRKINVGTHTIKATPYNTPDCKGTPGKAMERTFTVRPAVSETFCRDYECEEGYLLRENASTKVGNNRETCCYRERTCAAFPIGTPCSMGDITSSLIRNPSFETFINCPLFNGGLYLAESWEQATSSRSDFWAGEPSCDDAWRQTYLSGLPQNATDGDAFVGTLKLQDVDFYGYLGTCLISPLLAGVEYTFTLDIAAAPDSIIIAGNTNGNTELLCIPDCNLFPIDGVGYKGDEFEILATAQPKGGLIGGGDWKTITFVVKPTMDCPAIMFGPGIKQTVQRGQVGSYVIYDYLNLQVGPPGMCDSKGECVASL